MFEMTLTIVGLCVFEIVASLDNAVVNADVLATMSQKWRRWFFVWGIFFSVFLVRGLLPWVIVYMSVPELGMWGAMTATFSDDPHVAQALKKSAPLLLMGGGIFLVFLFLHWLFLETKEFGLSMEKHIHKHGVWFYALSSLLLTWVIWEALKRDPMLAFSATIGSSAFFITHGFKEHAAKIEADLKSKHLSDISKLVYLEVLDTTFSIDGVIGAFAFTMSVPLILLGNGIGALVVRDLTIRGVDKIRKYRYLKNGAMYSIFFLGTVMVLEGFGAHIPKTLPPVITIGVIGYFFWKSVKEVKAKS